MGVSERRLEDYICEHLELLVPFWNDIVEQTGVEPQVEIVGRQVRVPHGIIDLLVYCEQNYPSLSIVELKAKPLEEKDVGQLLRYMSDIKTLHYHNNCRLTVYDVFPDFDDLPALKHEIFWELFQETEWIGGVLIGADVSPKVRASCGGAGIEVYSFEMSNDEIRLVDPRITDQRLSKEHIALAHRLQTLQYHHVYGELDTEISARINAMMHSKGAN